MRPELLITCAALLVLVACKKDKEDEPQPQPPPVPQTGIVDIDGNYYDTLTIAGLTWFTENLQVTRFNNGDTILFDTSNANWNNSNPQSTVLDNDMGNKSIYGLLYNYRAFNDIRGLCPVGWHPGTDADWGILELALGMDPAEVTMNSYPSYGYRGLAANVAGKLKALQFWPTLDSVTNSSGMSLLPARARNAQQNGFITYASAFYWTPGGSSDWYRSIWDGSAGVIRRSPAQSSDAPGAGYSCRCVKD
ncbi:MAG: fibrobacter succinogenes major paralogous domain-containing protein [Flavobacteriales bacterium]|nr:fibrobacter succinogenes major paralogous domain-containing protein [Flavobacteriales bacterium]MBK6945779.1 fibrobacter succinogenes major paralogous domain-containing protein [Flavobacteriales bacterium]MBK7241879.1 fibrobacter succinogenes major paralogous domain-containing protein [Flavobacteriales bacterium]MBK7298795.1 fibrobacter succinogenes major paralogous domain-containing protein [Flavobacteriales bacterium]MBK9534670.1 fibrobacter succinogenes major paralogous domain-containing 